MISYMEQAMRKDGLDTVKWVKQDEKMRNIPADKTLIEWSSTTSTLHSFEPFFCNILSMRSMIWWLAIVALKNKPQIRKSTTGAYRIAPLWL